MSSASPLRLIKKNILINVENIVNALLLLILFLFPTADIIARKVFGTAGFPSSDAYMRHTLLLIASFSTLLTSRSKQHLNIGVIHGLFNKRLSMLIDQIILFWSIVILVALMLASLNFIPVGIGTLIGKIPLSLFLAILGLNLFFLSMRIIKQSELKHKLKISFFAFLTGLIFGSFAIIHFIDSSGIFSNISLNYELLYRIESELIANMHLVRLLLIAVTILLGLFGMPIYLVLSGISVILIGSNDGYIETITNSYYSLFTSNPILPSLPLFALVGFLLSESKASHRLVKLSNLLLSRYPGGAAIIAVVLSAFFTTFTGASGVTILALGGILSSILLKANYPKPFTIGLLTASGSVGLLFPPSLPVIMYGTQAHISIKRVFIAGLIPGSILVLTLSAMGFYVGLKILKKKLLSNDDSEKRESKPLKNVVLPALGEIILPIFILASVFFFQVTLVETSALAVLYVFILVFFIHRDIKLKSLIKIFIECLIVLGGILAIIGFANSISDYIAIKEIPIHLANFVESQIHSKYLFLFLLNILLLITGCIMDIYSAIIVVAPLVIAMGTKYNIAPEQLGIIFLANLELGYLTPPVGLSLFLSSYRFKLPLSKVYRYVLPFLLILFVVVLLITYVPWFSTVLLTAEN